METNNQIKTDIDIIKNDILELKSHLSHHKVNDIKPDDDSDLSFNELESTGNLPISNSKDPEQDNKIKPNDDFHQNSENPEQENEMKSDEITSEETNLLGKVILNEATDRAVRATKLRLKDGSWKVVNSDNYDT